MQSRTLFIKVSSGREDIVVLEQLAVLGSVGVGFFDSAVVPYLERVLTRISSRFWHDDMLKVMRDLLVHFCPNHTLLTNAATGSGEYCVEELLARVVPVAVGSLKSVDESREGPAVKSVVRAYCDLVHRTIDTFPSDDDEMAMECNHLLLNACTWLFNTLVLNLFLKLFVYLFPLQIRQTRDSIWLKERLEAGKSGDAGRPFDDVGRQGSEV